MRYPPARQGRQIPRGFILPAERDQRRAAAPARAPRGHSLLAGHFFTYYCRENNKFLDPAGRSILHFQPEALQVLMEHAWPGNVRELENVVERAVVLATEQSVSGRGVARRSAGGQRHPAHPRRRRALPADASLFEIVNDFERRVIMERLEHCSGSQTDAAESLHVRFPR